MIYYSKKILFGIFGERLRLWIWRDFIYLYHFILFYFVLFILFIFIHLFLNPL